MELGIESLEHVEGVVFRFTSNLLGIPPGLFDQIASSIFRCQPDVVLAQHSLYAFLGLSNEAIGLGLGLGHDLLALLVDTPRLLDLLRHGRAHQIENVKRFSLVDHDPGGHWRSPASIDDGFKSIYEHQNVDYVTSLEASEGVDRENRSMSRRATGSGTMELTSPAFSAISLIMLELKNT